MPPKQRLVVPDLMQSMPAGQTATRPTDSYTYPPNETYPGKPIDPSQNNLLKLSNALGEFEPGLAQANLNSHHKYTEEEAAAGEAAYHAGRGTWNEKIAAGQIPLGASPYFTKAYQQAQLRDAGADYAQTLAEAYHNDQTGIQNSDDPTKVRQWLNDQANQYRQKLVNPDGSAAFSALDIKQVFDPIQLQTNAAMQHTHVQNRIADHEAIGLQTASSEITKNLDYFSQGGFENMDEKGRADLGKKLNDVLFAPVHGLVENGLPRPAANKLLVDSVVQYATRPGFEDRSALNILDHIPTGRQVLPDGTVKYSSNLGAGGYAKQQRYAAEMHITQEEWKKEVQAHQRGDWQVQGTVEERLKKKAMDDAHTQLSWERATATYEKGVQDAAKLDIKERDRRMVDLNKGLIVTGVLNHDVYNVLVAKSLKDLAALDPGAAMVMNDYINKSIKEQGQHVDTPEGSAMFNDIRWEMSTKPEQFNSNKIHENGELLGDTKVGQLWDDWERIRTNMDHPFLQGPVYKNALNAVATGISKDPNFSLAGEGRVIAAQAQYQFRVQSQQWLADNPNAKLTEFNDFVDNSIRPAVLKNNKEMMAEAVSAQKRVDEQQKAHDEAVANPQVKEKPRSWTDTILMRPKQYENVPAPAAPAKAPGAEPISSTEQKVLMAPEAAKKLSTVEKDIQAGGKHSEADVRKLVQSKLEPMYMQLGRPKNELDAAVSNMTDQIMGKKVAPTVVDTPPMDHKTIKPLVSKESSAEMKDMASRLSKSGKGNVKPPTEAEVRDVVRRAYEPVYQKHRPGHVQELSGLIEEATQGMMGLGKPK